MEVSLKNLTKHYGTQIILNIDRMVFPHGEITALLGDNGTGKTTLLNVISGLDRDFTGQVHYNNKEYSRKILRNITYVFQKPVMMKTTVAKNVEWPLKIRKIPEYRQTALSILDKFNLLNLKNNKAHTLSGGEQQKLALARAIVFSPALLLLDEPTSNIDKNSIDIIEQVLLEYQNETKSTIIIVTHNKDQADRLAANQIHLH